MEFHGPKVAFQLAEGCESAIACRWKVHQARSALVPGKVGGSYQSVVSPKAI